MEMSAIPFLAVCIPLAITGMTVGESLAAAVPILLIFMAGYTINNLHDAEKDAVIHPERPLPAGHISIRAAAAIFFTVITLTLLSIKILVPAPAAYLYLLLLVGLMNYNYIVLYFPLLKNAVMAAIGIIPMLILARFPGPHVSIAVTTALFLFLLGMEMLSDTIDAHGDPYTLVKTIGINRAVSIAFCVKMLADVTLLLAASDRFGYLLAALLCLMDLLAWWAWHRQALRRRIMRVLGSQLGLGLYFLL